MAPVQTASEHITDTVTAWPGVEAGWGSRGEWAFRVAGSEIGHLHGDHVAHFGFRARWERRCARRAASARTR